MKFKHILMAAMLVLVGTLTTSMSAVATTAPVAHPTSAEQTGVVLIPEMAASAFAPQQDIGIQGCQGASAQLRYTYRTTSGGTAVWTQVCSAVYGLNSTGIRLQSGGWSGLVIFEGSDPVLFCNGADFPLGDGRVVGIYMSAVSASWC